MCNTSISGVKSSWISLNWRELLESRRIPKPTLCPFLKECGIPMILAQQQFSPQKFRSALTNTVRLSKYSPGHGGFMAHAAQDVCQRDGDQRRGGRVGDSPLLEIFSHRRALFLDGEQPK